MPPVMEHLLSQGSGRVERERCAGGTGRSRKTQLGALSLLGHLHKPRPPPTMPVTARPALLFHLHPHGGGLSPSPSVPGAVLGPGASET